MNFHEPKRKCIKKSINTNILKNEKFMYTFSLSLSFFKPLIGFFELRSDEIHRSHRLMDALWKHGEFFENLDPLDGGRVVF